MNNKGLNNRDLAIIKRIAQNVDADYQKVCKIEVKIKELMAEEESLQKRIDGMEAPVVAMTGGFKSTDIYEKTIIPQFNGDGTPKVDKEGRQLKVTKYSLRYPDTIFPPTEGTNCVEGEPVAPTNEEESENINIAVIGNLPFEA